MKDTDKITVCKECLTACCSACCWHGVFMCEKSITANTTVKTVAQLKKLHREHPSYWEDQLKETAV